MGHLPAEILGLLFSLIATLEGVLEMMQKSKNFLWDFVVRKKKNGKNAICIQIMCLIM